MMFGEDFETPWQEMIYAVAGLSVYLFIFLFTYFIAAYLLPSFWPVDIVLKNTITAQTFDMVITQYPLFTIFWVNFLLFVFNFIIFAIPLDGGRILKSILTIIFGQYSANKIIPIISKIVAFIMVVIGLLFWDVIIVILGVFVYFMSVKEARENEILLVLSDKRVNEFVKPTELLFKSEETVLSCFEKMKEELIPEALVHYGKNQYGVIDADKIAALSKVMWAEKKVGEIAEKVAAATDREKLGFIAQYLVEKNLSIIPVIHSHTKGLIGIIKRSDLADFLKIHKIVD